MKDTVDIFAEGFPFLKKTAVRFAAYTLFYIWTLNKQYESTDEIVTTFFYWFFQVSLVLAMVSFIGFVFFANGYMDYLKADKKLLDNSQSKKLKDWDQRVGLFSKVGLDKSVAITLFIFCALTPIGSLQIKSTDNVWLICGLFILIGLIAIGVLYLYASWEYTYKLIDREVHALDTNKQLLLRDNEASWNKIGFFGHQKFVIVLLICVSLILLVCLQPLSNFIEAHICSK